ncbi:MAG: response regulator [Candidatus Obscuribacterales bacterium]|nr:response regulator [Candidatus Obscuribacterales bacterium]
MTERSILVVDDDSHSRKLVTVILQKAGYQVIAASGGAEALERMKDSDAPSLVVCDWMMPEINGIDVCEAIRQAPDDEYVYFILLTARAQTSDMVEGISAGANDYLTKPFDQNELLARVQAGERILDLHKKLLNKRNTIKDFAYALTHDLRTPMLALNMTMQQSIDGIYGDLPEQYQGLLKKSIASIRDLLDLTDSLLAVAKYDEDIIVLEFTENNLSHMIEDCCSSLRPLLLAKNIQLASKIDDRELSVTADRTELKRLIFNLMANAIKYTPAGGQILVSCSTTDGKAELMVEDSGEGIPPAYEAHLFKRFHKSEKGRRTIGTGLGLYLCQRIVAEHGGEISYQRSSLGGSAFKVVLPPGKLDNEVD